MSIEFCEFCRTETMHSNGKCVGCVEKDEKQRTNNWNKLPLEEKLDNIYQRLLVLEKDSLRGKIH